MSMRYLGGILSSAADNPTRLAASGIWTMRNQLKSIANTAWPIRIAAGQQEYIVPGNYSWVAPTNVSVVHVVAVGSGAGGSLSTSGYGGGGGGLGWKNNIFVTPGQSYIVSVGERGFTDSYLGGANSYFYSNTVICGRGGGSIGVIGGNRWDPGLYTGDGGGNGGSGSKTGGAGAGGYTGNGGNAGANGAGGGAAGGWYIYAGGGVGIYGQGASGIYTINSGNAPAGSNGQSGQGFAGGKYGGGGGTTDGSGTDYGFRGGNGAVRIIWGTGRAWPSTLTTNM